MKFTKIDIGCGKNKEAFFVGIDIYNWKNIYPKGEFICGRIPGVLRKFKSNSVEEVRAHHFLEHLEQKVVIKTFNEIYRILKPNGIFKIYVPSTEGKGAFCDPTHRSWWNDWSFRYFDMRWDRELSASYGIKCNFWQEETSISNDFELHTILRKI